MRGLLFIFFWLMTSPLWASASLSDLATEYLEKDYVTSGSRNIFVPAEIKGEIDITSLTLEGILIGNKTQLALLSGQILRIGDPVGTYQVSKILPGELVLTSKEQEYRIKMEGYISPLHKIDNATYAIELRNAGIREALRLLSIAAGYNLITPEDIQGRVNLSFQNTTLQNAIKSILKVNGYNYAMENGIMRVGKPDQFLGGTDLLATTIPLKYAKSADLEKPIKLLLSDKGSVSFDPRTNTLSIKDYDANVESVRNFVSTVDRKDQQVAIEAHIVDAKNDFSRSLGIQWGAEAIPTGKFGIAGPDTTGSFTVGTDSTATKSMVHLGATSPTSGTTLRIGNLPGATNLDVQLTAAEERGDIRIISKPSVVTLNNMPAKLRSGVTIYVKSTSDISIGTSSTSSSASSSDLQSIETGIELNVTPQITPNNYVKLTIEAEESEADFSRTTDGIPAVIDNFAATTVFLHNGETAVIGGLIKRKDTLIHKGVPGFSKIPVVGVFFKSKTKTKTDNELMIFITPRIVAKSYQSE